MDPETFLDGVVVSVAPEPYAVALVESVPEPPPFAVVRDEAGTTVVAREDRLEGVETRECTPGWRLLSFEAELPFGLVGFLARVTTALAEAEVPVFALSSYPTDHLLVRAADLAAATERLGTLGCRVEGA
jgi:hypothetical protein